MTVRRFFGLALCGVRWVLVVVLAELSKPLLCYELSVLDDMKHDQKITTLVGLHDIFFTKIVPEGVNTT